jgi:hypothetical protein
MPLERVGREERQHYNLSGYLGPKVGLFSPCFLRECYREEREAATYLETKVGLFSYAMERVGKEKEAATYLATWDLR